MEEDNIQDSAVNRVFYLLILALFLGSLLLAGCQAEPGTPAAIEGKTLNLYGIDPITLDPAVSAEMTSHKYIMQVFGGLVKLGKNLEPEPDIAREWQLSPDGRTYTFYLRDDVEFHDGRQVKAGDFKYSWERACDPATGSQTVETYLGDISGVKDVIAGKSSEISGVRIIDDFTLQVNLDTPRSYFLFKMAYPTSYVVDKADVERGRNWWQQPNGTGPFKLEKWEKSQLLVLEKNKRYYGQVTGVEQVIFHLWGGLPINMYETGDIDVTGVSVSYIDKITDRAGPFHQDLQVTPELSFEYIGFNATKPPFDDVSIRQAFTMAIDKEKLTSLLFRDMVQPAHGILPPGIPGFNEDLVGLGFNANRAGELIAASKYGSVDNLPPITITTSGWGGLISSPLEAIIAEWRNNLGVEVTVRQLEPERFLYYLSKEKNEMYYMGWIADYPHPQNFLEILFHTGFENNYSEYSNPDVDALLDKASLEQDFEISMKLYRQAEQMMVDDAACLPLWFGQNYILVKPNVEGYELNPMGIADLSKVSVD